jgi:hypothetical protein
MSRTPDARSAQRLAGEEALAGEQHHQPARHDEQACKIDTVSSRCFGGRDPTGDQRRCRASICVLRPSAGTGASPQDSDLIEGGKSV